MFANNLPKLWSSCLNIPYGDLNIIFIIITITITVILSLCHLLRKKKSLLRQKSSHLPSQWKNNPGKTIHSTNL